jgi:hypothetical protein
MAIKGFYREIVYDEKFDRYALLPKDIAAIVSRAHLYNSCKQGK